MEICLTLEEFSAIMGKLDVSTLILPTTNKDFFDMSYQFLGIPPAMAQRLCMLNKLNIHMIFAYFSQRNVPLAGVQHFHYLNPFCLCLLVRYFLVHETPCVDQRMLLVVKNLEKGSSVGIILAETLNGLDVVRKGEATFFIGSPFLLQV